MIRDRIVFGVKDSRLQERLLRWESTETTDLTLDKRWIFVAQLKTTKSGMKVLTDRTETNVNAISRRNKNKQQHCSKCGQTHDYAKCPAWSKKCHKCNKHNHFALMCRNEYEERRGTHDHRDKHRKTYKFEHKYQGSRGDTRTRRRDVRQVCYNDETSESESGDSDEPTPEYKTNHISTTFQIGPIKLSQNDKPDKHEWCEKIIITDNQLNANSTLEQKQTSWTNDSSTNW